MILPQFSRSQAQREEGGNGNEDQTVSYVTITLPQLSRSQAEREKKAETEINVKLSTCRHSYLTSVQS